MSLYEVEDILDKRYNIKTGQEEYRVKWEGYPESQATWEPISNLQYVLELIQEF
jgi:hypothetical protein